MKISRDPDCSWAPLISLLVLLTASPLAAQPTPLGEDMQVNTYTTGNVRATSVAVNPATGDFVVVWDSAGSSGDDASGYSVLGQLFSSDGSPIADEFQVNSLIANDQTTPQVAMNSAGAFAVVWNSYNEVGDMSSGIRAQPFASDGSPVGSQLMVNTNTTQGQLRAKVVMNDAGDFVVNWIDEFYSGFQGSSEFRRYASDGTALGAISVAGIPITSGFIGSTDIGLQPGGGFVIVWEDVSSATDSDETIQGRLFDSAGVLIGDQFQVNTYTTGNQNIPAVEVDGDGDFVVVWQSYGSAGDDADGYSVQARRFSSDGTAIGDEIQVNTNTTDDQRNLAVAVADNGEFLVAWSDYADIGDDTRRVQAAYFASDGQPIGGNFQMNAYTTASQGTPSMTTDGDGRFLVSWTSFGSTGTDTSLASAQVRRFVVVDISGQVFFDADFNGLRDDGEAAVENVEVHLFDATDDSLLESTFTDIEGTYVFEDRVGEYYLEFEAPPEYVFTFQNLGSDDSIDSDVDAATGRTADFFSFETDTFDAGITNGIGDRVWLDQDGDGQQDGSESGAVGVAVRLFEMGGGEVASTITGADGRYAFADLSPATYHLAFTAPTGFVFSPRDQGSDDAADSDVNPANGETTSFIFVYGDLDLDFDAGLEVDGDQDGVADRIDNCPSDANSDQADADGDGIGDVCDTSSIGDRVWLDANMNGLQDGGESGFEGVTVELFSAAGVSQGTTLSAADGSYSFSDVAGGDYYLAFYEPVGFCYTTRDQGSDDAIDSDVDPTTFTTPVFTLIEGADDPTRDAGLVPDASIGNRVWLDDGNGIQDGGEPGLENIAVHLYDESDALIDSASTDASGFYSFSPGPGDFYLEFILPADMAFAPRDRGPDDGADSDVNAASGTTSVFTLGPGQVDASRDAGLEPAVIGNRVWHDINGDGLQQPGEAGFPGLVVRLLDAEGSEIASTLTNLSGIYGFLGVATGSYRIEVVAPAGGVFSAPNVGEDDGIDSDVDPASGLSDLFAYEAGAASQGWDAGLRVHPLFADGFESGDASAWSGSVP